MLRASRKRNKFFRYSSKDMMWTSFVYKKLISQRPISFLSEDTKFLDMTGPTATKEDS